MRDWAVLAVAVLALVGCEQLRIESPPSGEALTCDPTLAGWWQVVSESPVGGEDPLHLYVSNDCQEWLIVETQADRPEVEHLSSRLRFQFRRVAGGRYLVISDLPDLPEERREIGADHLLLRYVPRADRIDVFQGDPRREAHRIAEGLIRGRVESSSIANCGAEGHCNVNTTITGDGEAISAWIRRFDPIDRALLELRRIPETSAAKLDALLKRPTHDVEQRPEE